MHQSHPAEMTATVPPTPVPLATALDCVLARLDAIGRDLAAIDARLAALEAGAGRPAPALLDTDAAAAFLCVGRTAFYGLRDTPGFPRAVAPPGCRPLYKRAELERWVGRQRPARRRAALASE